MLLVHGEATAIDDRTPTLLTGYGGFNITETPAWSPFVAAWCEAGGQVAVPGIRGGGEEGEAWHQAGMRDRKPQVFADFEAARSEEHTSELQSLMRISYAVFCLKKKKNKKIKSSHKSNS